ncbi:MAG: hypothetical protein JWO07_833 [Candidatus Saccharibacteria bacterium]|nr:hypothetical protein [Candidatus Saccharibacteria bacterium]
MPIIYQFTKPGANMGYWDIDDNFQVNMKKVLDEELNRRLPALIVENAAVLRLDADTTEHGVMILPFLFPEHTVNAPDLWMLFSLSEPPPNVKAQRAVRTELRGMLAEWFTSSSFVLPRNFAVDIAWGPTRGFGVVNDHSLLW